MLNIKQFLMRANIFLRLDPLICQRFSYREAYFYAPIFFVIRYYRFPYLIRGRVIQTCFARLSRGLVPR